MKQIFFLSLFIFLWFGNLQAQTKYDLNINFEGRSREFIVSVPTKSPPANGYSLVFMLHGTSGDKDVFYNAKGWRELGQAENFVTVFPSALRWCFFEDGGKKNTTRFVCGSVVDSICEEDKPKLIDEVAFLKKLVEIISDTLPINRQKVFMNGFSNGSCMSHKIAMDAGDVFAAAAGSSSMLHELDSITPLKRIPFWIMVGSKDDRFFSPNFPNALPYGGDSILLYLNKSISRALVCQGLSKTYQKVETNVNKTYIWKECLPGEICAPYIFTLNKDQSHEFPNGNNHPVNAPKLFWEFFNNPPSIITSQIEIEEQKLQAITVYPNPISDQLYIASNIEQPSLWSVKILNIHGQIMAVNNGFGILDTTMETAAWLPGIYCLHLTLGKSHVFKKVAKY